jgi:hypothetical protein
VLGTSELAVVAIAGLAGLGVPVATIVLLVLVYRKLSDIQAELRRMNKDGRG